MDWGKRAIEASRFTLRDLHERAGRAIQQLDEQEINWRPNEESNSVANLVLHLEGNFRERFGSWIGGIPYTRDRAAEFDARDALSREEALGKLNEIFSLADRTLAGLCTERLEETHRFRDRDIPLFEHLFLLTNHAAEHVGQILYIAKLQKGPAYQVLSRHHRR